MDVRRKSKFPAELTGNHREAVLAYEYIPERQESGKKFSRHFKARVKILDSDNRLAVGREYTLAFWLDGEYQQYADRERGAFIAACMGQTLDDPEFDVDAAEQTLIDSSEKGDFNPDEAGVHPCQIFHTRTSKQKEYAVMENGKPVAKTKLVPNDFFNPVA
jgi:hypothetical protein